MMKSFRISSWDKSTGRLVTTDISESEVAAFAAQLQAKTAGETALPGFELSSDHEDWGTLAVALAPFGWALVHTGKDHLTLHCTYAKNNPREKAVEVQWDELTSIPRRWFILRDQALEGVRQWMRDGTLLPNIPWSDKCY